MQYKNKMCNQNTFLLENKDMISHGYLFYAAICNIFPSFNFDMIFSSFFLLLQQTHKQTLDKLDPYLVSTNIDTTILLNINLSAMSKISLWCDIFYEYCYKKKRLLKKDTGLLLLNIVSKITTVKYYFGIDVALRFHARPSRWPGIILEVGPNAEVLNLIPESSITSVTRTMLERMDI